MQVDYGVAIVGSGPAGLSAAVRAALMGMSHVLLERMPHLTDTVVKYQKRKHVMAAPHALALRCDIGFEEGHREDVLDTWQREVERARVNVRCDANVAAITGSRGNFAIALEGGETITAEIVILAVGTQGNPRKLDIPGADLPFVEYWLEDAEEICGEKIIVIGGGDAAIENALALASANAVTMVCRSANFLRSRPANAALIRRAFQNGHVTGIFDAVPKRVELGGLVVHTHQGEVRLSCDRIIARLGALPSRDFLERCGLRRRNGEDGPHLALSATHESEIPGLYVVGAIAGTPLIKHCLKQGYEVIEAILANDSALAEEKLLQQKLDKTGTTVSIAALIEMVRRRMPLFAPLPTPVLRGILLAAEFRRPQAGEILYRKGDFTRTLYAILEGEIALEAAEAQIVLRQGDFLGAIEFAAGSRRSATARVVATSLLLEANAGAMARVARAHPAFGRAIADAAIKRQIKLHLAPGIDDARLEEVIRTAQVVRFATGETLIAEGASNDPIYLLRKGSVTLSRRIDGEDVIIAFIPNGGFIGEIASLSKVRDAVAVKAVIATEAIRIDRGALARLLVAVPELRPRIAQHLARILGQGMTGPAAAASESVSFLLQQGLGEATNVIAIDESQCVQCDNCEKACAETHGGLSSLDRHSGVRQGHLHLPNACRHCEHAYCMSDCPVEAIQRAPDGTVYIDDICTGCGNCERNCPYDAIRMAATPARKPGLLAWLLFGRGSGPGEDRTQSTAGGRTAAVHAVKCDLCRGQAGGPACVAACPTGAATRATPESLIAATLRRRG